MRKFYMVRSNLRILEYYHQYKTLNEFEKKCHDYYMLLPLWLLQENYFDEVIVFRLQPKKKVNDIIFDINGKKYIQKFVNSFSECFDYPKPDLTFFRGGFPEYDAITKMNKKFFHLSLYLGAGRRIIPQWNGIYDIYLMEDERDFVNGKRCIPFYKTTSPNIFYPIKNSKLEYDICWPANFSQVKYKGQESFIKLIKSSPYLQNLKIVHCGNKESIGMQLCEKYNIKNIEFVGLLDRLSLNNLLNKSRFGLNTSNLQDGCPRASTEILMSGTPLILKDTVRLLKFYRKKGVVNVNDRNITDQIISAIKNYEKYKTETLDVIKNELSFDNINKKNIDLWSSL